MLKQIKAQCQYLALPTYLLPTYDYKRRFKYFLSQMTEAMINFNRNILGTEEKMIQLE